MDWTTNENADYFTDMGTSIRDRKRHRGGEARYVPNSDRYDEDIVLFLEGLEEFWEQKFKGGDEEDEEDDEEEEEEDDPSYMDFLGNLKEYGNAYMCDVSMEHGVLSRIVYEEDDDYVPVKRKIPTSRQGACSSEKKKVGGEWRSNLETSSALQNDSHDKYQMSSDLNNSNFWNNHSDGVKWKIPISDSGDFLREHQSLHLNGDQRSGPVCSSFGEQVSEEVDTKYKEFLDNLYFIDGSVFYDNGDNKRIFYECRDQQTTDDSIPVKRKISTSRQGGCSREKKKVGDDWRSNLETSSAPQNGSRDKYQRSSDLNTSNARDNNSDGVKGKVPNSDSGDFLREHRSLHVNGDRRSDPVCSTFGERVSEEVDTKYNQFLNNLHVIDGCEFYEYGGNKRIFYKRSYQQTPDVESEPLQTDIRSPTSTQRPPGKNPKLRPLISKLEPSTSMPRPATPPSREQITTQRRAPTTTNNMPSTSTYKNEENSRGKFSSFWKELHQYLRKPYKQKEYDDLMHHVSLQRRVSIYRASRSGGSERPGELGKSYLQHFPVDYLKLCLLLYWCCFAELYAYSTFEKYDRHCSNVF